MDLDRALDWAGQRSDAVLITIRRDGRPQSSDIVYDLRDDVFKISVTEDRAKTVNMARDPRVVLHLTDRGSWSYISFDGEVTLSAVTTDPGDAAGDALVEYYKRVTGKDHPDWDEYRAAMISERRLIVSFRPTSAVGQAR